MKKILFGLILIMATSIYANEIRTCDVKIRLRMKEKTKQNGLVYGYQGGYKQADLIVYGPKDPKRDCEDTPQIEKMRLPINISPTHSVGLTLMLMVISSDEEMTLGSWDSHTLEELLGVYGGIRIGASLGLGAQGFTMAKMDVFNWITLKSVCAHVLGPKVDLSLAGFSISKATKSEYEDLKWDTVLIKH